MSNYNDPSSTFKLIQGADVVDVSRRNMAIFDMLLNGLGIPDKFHEFVRAVFISGNWQRHQGWEEIPYKRLARNVSSLSDQVFTTVYNRIKKNAPEFFKWQEQKKLDLISHESFKDEGGRWPKVRYAFPHYPTVAKLFSLDKSTNQKEIRKMVDTICKTMPRVEKTPRTKKVRTTETAVQSVVQHLLSIQESMTSKNEFFAELEIALESCNFKWPFKISIEK